MLATLKISVLSLVAKISNESADLKISVTDCSWGFSSGLVTKSVTIKWFGLG